ncbi:MAG: hypothetical protein U0165_19150 [Polyangiaceae bacterium]
MSKSPLQIVKEKFGEKAKLVEAIKALATDDLWLNRTNSEKGLEFVSNAKLLRLHAVFTAVKEKFGTRAKLIAAIAELENRAKDAGYIKRLGEFPVPRLFDAWKSADLRSKRAKAAAAKPKAVVAKKPRTKKAKLKSAEAKKAAPAAAAAPAKAEKKAEKKGKK